MVRSLCLLVGFAFEGIPDMIYMDNGPIARSHVFHQVMKYLGITVKTHLPKGKDGRGVTARAKGKVERPFRTVKAMYETLFHLYEPETELEANAGLVRFLQRYNSMRHRIEPHSRLGDWIENLPPSGIIEQITGNGKDPGIFQTIEQKGIACWQRLRSISVCPGNSAKRAFSKQNTTANC